MDLAISSVIQALTIPQELQSLAVTIRPFHLVGSQAPSSNQAILSIIHMDDLNLGKNHPKYSIFRYVI